MGQEAAGVDDDKEIVMQAAACDVVYSQRLLPLSPLLASELAFAVALLLASA